MTRPVAATGLFDRDGRELDPAAVLAAAESVRTRSADVVVELVDAQGLRVTTVRVGLTPEVAATVAAARLFVESP